uniref:Putative secreted protein n=1 Tax=Anopheles marajoara TaxID=58244 RepID=A0A2M4CCK3_9DIPT
MRWNLNFLIFHRIRSPLWHLVRSRGYCGLIGPFELEGLFDQRMAIIMAIIHRSIDHWIEIGDRSWDEILSPSNGR